jgi:hypothetical protein
MRPVCVRLLGARRPRHRRRRARAAYAPLPAAHLQGQRDRDLDTLERRRLVGRRRLEHDRRAAVVAITPPGQELVKRLFPEHSSCVARAFAPLDDDEKRTLVELCRRLAAT